MGTVGPGLSNGQDLLYKLVRLGCDN